MRTERPERPEQNFTATAASSVSFLLGMAEGLNAAAPMTIFFIPVFVTLLGMPGIYLALGLGALTFFCAAFLNYYLVKKNTNDAFVAISGADPNANTGYNNLSTSKKLAYWASLCFSFIGSGVVFALVFMREASRLLHFFAAPWSMLFELLIIVGALAEVIGITSLVHQSTYNFFIKDTGRENPPADDSHWVTLYNKLSDRWTHGSPLYLLLAVGASVFGMVFYSSMIFHLFSTIITLLLTSYLALPLATASTVAYVLAGINMVTLFASFTRPLGTLLLDITDTLLYVPLFLAAAVKCLFSQKRSIEQIKNDAQTWHQNITGVRPENNSQNNPQNHPPTEKRPLYKDALAALALTLNSSGQALLFFLDIPSLIQMLINALRSFAMNLKALRGHGYLGGELEAAPAP